MDPIQHVLSRHRFHATDSGDSGFCGGPYCAAGVISYEQYAAHVAEMLAANLGRPAATLRPCHVTGMHEPNHHLKSDHVCSLQAKDIAERMLEGVNLATLPRELHPNCYWCGTSGDDDHESEGAPQQRAWVVTPPGEQP